MTGFEAGRLGLPGRLLGRGGGHRHPLAMTPTPGADLIILLSPRY